MLRFDNDYTQGACQEVLDALVRTNWEQTGGYGKDEYCRQAEERIRSLCQAPEARVHFLTGGTQTNLTLIAAALRVLADALRVLRAFALAHGKKRA